MFIKSWEHSAQDFSSSESVHKIRQCGSVLQLERKPTRAAVSTRESSIRTSSHCQTGYSTGRTLLLSCALEAEKLLAIVRIPGGRIPGVVCRSWLQHPGFKFITSCLIPSCLFSPTLISPPMRWSRKCP